MSNRGKAAIEKFLMDFVRIGLVGETDEILVNGPPWRTRVCILLTDQARDELRSVVYENRAVLFCRVVWGKIVYQEDFEDTHKIERFEEHLQRKGLVPG